MRQNIKTLTKQLVIAAFILALVTVLSLGIRHVRFSAHRINTIDSSVVADLEDQSQTKQSFYASTEPDHYPAESYTVDTEPDPQYAEPPYWDEQELSDDYSEEYIDSDIKLYQEQ